MAHGRAYFEEIKMGIDTSSAIFVGLPRDEIENQELIENEDVEQCSPYYDGYEASLAGFFYLNSGDYSASEININLQHIEDLKAQFKEVTGQDAKVWLTPNIY